MNQRKVCDGLILSVGWYFSSCTEAVTRVTLGALWIEDLEVGHGETPFNQRFDRLVPRVWKILTDICHHIGVPKNNSMAGIIM